MKTLRTFIALPLKVDNQFLLAREKMMEKLARERISWVDPHRYHVTIRFLGDTSPELLEKIRRSMREGIKVPGKAIVQLGHSGSFGPRKKPRVVWVGFKDSSPFEMLREEVEAALAICGIKAADQPFTPHVTLGRVRELMDLQRYYRVIDSMKDQFSGKILADRLVFYRSELGTGGPVYSPLEEVLFPDQVF